MILCVVACAPLTQSNKPHDIYSISGAQATMCWVKKYLGVEIGVSTGSTSRSLTAFFFGKNGIIYQYKLGALESISNKERYKLDNYNNTHEMIARNGKLMSALCLYFFLHFQHF